MHSNPPPIPETNSSSGPASSRIWKVGTLTYTSAGLITLFCWLLWGDFAYYMKERAVIPIAQLVLKQFKASDMVVGLLVGSLPAALGLILGPVVGVMSDRHRGHWGRRIPYLLIPTPFIALSMFGLAFTPYFGEWLHLVLGDRSPGVLGSQLLAFGFFWTLFEVASVIANSVFGGLINDVVPAEVMGKFFGLFRAVSLIAGIIFNYWMIGSAETHYKELFIGIGIFYAGGIALMCFKVKEGNYPPVSENEVAKPGFIKSTQTYLRECFAHPYYLVVFIAMMLGNLAPGPVNAFSVFYAKSVGMSVETYGKYAALTYGISLSLSFFLGMAADRFHPLRLTIVSTLLYMAFMLWGGFYATTQNTFAFAFVAHGVLSGTYFTAVASLGQRLFPREKFGQMASAAGIFGALSFAVLPPLVGWMLDFTEHTYRYTFLFSGALALIAGVAFLVVHYHFMKYGGPKNYQAPD